MHSSSYDKPAVGWREWLAIPTLGIDRIKAKIDTGARTSVLHAYDVRPFLQDGVAWVRFVVHPLQRNNKVALECTAPIVDRREVTSSSGHSENRHVVQVEIALGGETWPIEMTLTDRDQMGFRMLLGRTAVEGRLVVDPDQSYMMGKLRPPRKKRPTKSRRTVGKTFNNEEATP
jgi:hypothetical protein